MRRYNSNKTHRKMVKKPQDSRNKLSIPSQFNKHNPKYQEFSALVWDYNNNYLPPHKIVRLNEFIKLFESKYKGEPK